MALWVCPRAGTGSGEGSRLGAWAASSAVPAGSAEPAVLHPVSSSFPPGTPPIAWQTKTGVSAAPFQGEIKPSPVPGRCFATTRRAPLARLSPALCQQIRGWEMYCRDLAVV